MSIGMRKSLITWQKTWATKFIDEKLLERFEQVTA